MPFFLNKIFLKYKVYNSVLQTLEKMRKLYKYYGCPKPNVFKDWTNHLHLIRSLIYVLHKDSKTTLPSENMSKLYQALPNWTYAALHKSTILMFQKMIQIHVLLFLTL
jgi:hypothetical protein